MNSHLKYSLKKGSFEWVKRQLNPRGSYIVFENTNEKDRVSIFSENHQLLEYLKKKNFKWQHVFDEKLKREYMVIEIDPGKEEELLGKLMGLSLPKETVYYLYKAETE